MSEQTVNRRLAAIVAADVVGYSRLMAADEEGTVARLHTLRAQLIDPALARHGGRVVKTMGDGMLIEFPSVVDAVRCCVSVQQRMATEQADMAEARRIDFRVGINLGDVIVDGEDIYGDGVNVAARLEQLAEPGGINISGAAFHQVRGHLDVGHDDLGELELKNIPEPVRVYRLRLDAVARPRRPGRARGGWRGWRRSALVAAVVLLAIVGGAIWWPRPPPDTPSIAVLPFENLGGDPQQVYLADGVTDNIINQLSRLGRLLVIARRSTSVYKGKPVNVQTVASELDVRYVLAGSVQQSEDRVRITTELVDSRSGKQVWAERYDRDLGEIFALQDDITLKVVTALQVKLTEGEWARMASRETNNLEAYIQYYQGVSYFMRFSADDNVRSRAFFERAIELDSGFTQAWVNLAWTYQLAARFTWSEAPEKAYERAYEIAQKARALDDANPGVYSLLSEIYRTQGKFDEAIAAGRKAIELGPGIADNYAILAITVFYAGDFEEALRMIKKAIRLHPNHPSWFLYRLGTAYRMLGRYDEAVEALEEFRRRQLPTPNLLTLADLAVTYSMMGREQDARATVAEALALDPQASLGRVAQMHHFKDRAHLERMLDALRKAGLPE
ncbi:MAG: adenylate/guanylate cyclase domain-containing protein [Paracoccaceae bacterium]